MTSELNYDIKLIVGLGNPGSKYALTRHNAGVWFIKGMLKNSCEELQAAKVAKAKTAAWKYENYACDLMVPDVYMNLNGIEIGRYMRYFKLLPQNLLVVHDEMDFAPGTVKLKIGGGCAGHNGLKSIKNNLQSEDFLRLRVGVGRPAHPEEVSNYVLSVPSRDEYDSILSAIDMGLAQLPNLLSGDVQRVMQELHSEN